MVKAWIILTAAVVPSTIAFTPHSIVSDTHGSTKLLSSIDVSPTNPAAWFSGTEENKNTKVEKLKAQVLQLGATLDRGQAYNPTSGEYYSETMAIAKGKIQDLMERADPVVNIPKTLDDIKGEWCENGVFHVCRYIANISLLLLGMCYLIFSTLMKNTGN